MSCGGIVASIDYWPPSCIEIVSKSLGTKKSVATTPAFSVRMQRAEEVLTEIQKVPW